MSWHEFTWDASDTTEAMIDGIASALATHPAWEFIETVQESYRVEAYDSDPVQIIEPYAMPISIWKCSGALNGTGEDFYLAIGWVKSESWDQENQQRVYGDGGTFYMLGMEDYDVETHRPIFPVGKYTSQAREFDDDYRLKREVNYPFFEIIEEPEGTYGHWSYPGMIPEGALGPDPDLKAQTPHPNGVLGPNYYNTTSWSGSGPPPGAVTYGVKLRVTKDGLFVFVNQTGSDSPFVSYVGAYDISQCPEAFRTENRLMTMFSYMFGAWSSVPNLLLPKSPGVRRNVEISGELYAAPALSSFGYYSAAPGTPDREMFFLPGFEDYQGIPWGASLYGGYGAGYGIPHVIYAMPGLYLLSTQGAPDSWTSWEDTMTSPDGHECAIFKNSGAVFLLDKELD